MQRNLPKFGTIVGDDQQNQNKEKRVQFEMPDISNIAVPQLNMTEDTLNNPNTPWDIHSGTSDQDVSSDDDNKVKGAKEHNETNSETELHSPSSGRSSPIRYDPTKISAPSPLKHNIPFGFNFDGDKFLQKKVQPIPGNTIYYQEYSLPWFFKSNLVFTESLGQLNQDFENLPEGSSFFGELRKYLDQYHYSLPGIRLYYQNKEGLSRSVLTKIGDILRSVKDGLRPIQEAEELICLIMEVALSQKQHELTIQNSVELDQHKMIFKSLQSALSVATSTFEEATKGLTADRTVIQNVHKDLKEIQLNQVTYKSTPSVVERESKPMTSRVLQRDYIIKGALVSMRIPGEGRAIGIVSIGPTPSLRKILGSVRADMNPEEPKILNEAHAGFFKTADAIFQSHGLELKI